MNPIVRSSDLLRCAVLVAVPWLLVAGLVVAAPSTLRDTRGTQVPTPTTSPSAWPSGAVAAPRESATTAAGPLDLQVLHPDTASTTTTREVVHVACRTAVSNRARVGDVEVPVLSTGIFVRDNVPLVPGANRIPVTITTPTGTVTTRFIDLERQRPPPPRPAPPPFPLFVDRGSVTPAGDVQLAPGEELDVAFRGAPGHLAQVQVCADPWTPLVEEIDPRTRRPTGLYRRTLIPAGAEDVPATPVRCRLTPTGQPAGIESSVISTALTTAPIVVESTARVGMFGARTVRLAVVKSPSADLAFGLHEIRLGGPYLTRVPAGTVLRVTGQRGDHYRVRLTPTLDAWVPLQAVTWASPTARVPHLAFTSMVVEGEATADRVSIPYAQPVPFSVEPAQGPDGRAALHIDFYGAHCAATWITHRASARLIREVSVHQVATGHVRVRVDLEHRRLWGWRVEPGRGSLTVVVRAPPPVDPAPALPLRGLAIALEAGHGGTSQGARGLAQVDEKEVNRLVTEGLAKELIAVGARVVIIRNGDETVSLEERCQRTMKANANLFVSIHANASDTDRGFLRVGGASTYYKHSTSRDLAVAVQAALLRRTGLPDFGCVGNFNYLPVRALTWMPAVLVEQAFLSNPVEEAKLLDGEFRKRLIAAVREGIEEFVRTRGE